MSLVSTIVLFFVCLILYKPKWKSFILWLAICAAVFCFISASAGIWGVLIYIFIWSNDGLHKDAPHSFQFNEDVSETSRQYGKIYENGTSRVENLSRTGYYYSDGKESWNGILGEEHRSNGEVVRENAYLPNQRDIYNAKGEYIGYEYEDALGITHRVDQ